MSQVNNKEFKIINKCKEFSNTLDNILENVPRKDMFYKDRLKNETLNLIKNIYYINGIDDKEKIKDVYSELCANIALIDYELERLYLKKYIVFKTLEKIAFLLIEINKMCKVWVTNKLNDES